MDNSTEVLSLVLDSITEHIVVINNIGEIQYANKGWSTFGNNNACSVGDDWHGVNYLDKCDRASDMGDDFGTQAGMGIRRVIQTDESIFYFEYPCHSPDEKRWFMMRVTPLQSDRLDYYVISHQNITERKLAEEEVLKLARIDGLTDIANRRSFDQFLHDEWQRCARLNKPISLAIVDLDHFKLLNDKYGHQSGDDCLVKVGALLKAFDKRPGDLCARYGGEEFAVVWGDTPLEQAKQLSNNLRKDILALNIVHGDSPIAAHVTASIGLAHMIPTKDVRESELIAKADNMLYAAKRKGRNRVEC